MKTFVAILLLSASAMGKTTTSSVHKSVNSFAAAEPREAFHGSSSGWDVPTTTFIEQPYTTSYPSAPPATAFGFGGNVDLGLPGFVNTAFTFVLAVVGLALLTQLITRLSRTPFFTELFADGGRSLNPETMSKMTDFAYDAIVKLQDVYGKQ